MAKATPAKTGTEIEVAGGSELDAQGRITKLDYAIVRMSAEAQGDVALALQENLGSNSLSAYDFDRLSVPAGGGLAWTVTNPETDEQEPAKYIEGVVVSWNDQKAYWEKSLSDAGATKGPPQCFSLDTKVGIGDPGGPCAVCKFNKFGTARGGTGKGKACKDVRLLFIVTKDDVMPRVLTIPPTSIKPVKMYFRKLAGKAIPYWQAVTQFKLIGDKNSAGTEYSKVEPVLAGILGGSAKDTTRAYGEVVRKMLSQAEVQARPQDVMPNGSDGDDDDRAI